MSRQPQSHNEKKSPVISEVSAEDIRTLIEARCGAVPHIHDNKGTTTVIFTPQGASELYQVTAYGLIHPANQNESQYAMYGYYFCDDAGATTTVICHVLPLASASRAGSAAAVCANGDTSAWKHLAEQEQFYEKYGRSNMDVQRGVPINPLYEEYGPVRRIGFGHTHPGLHVFWSGTDRGSVFAAEGEPWVSLVVDPRNCEILAGVGPDLTKPSLVLYEYEAMPHSQDPDMTTKPGVATPNRHRRRRFRLSPWFYQLLIESVFIGLIVSFLVFLVLLIMLT